MSAVMLLTVLIAAVIAIATLVIHSLARRAEPATSPPGLRRVVRASAEAPCGSKEYPPLADPGAWQCVTVADLRAAEELLDWAESEGYEQRELTVLGDSTFLVRWRGRGGAAARDD